MPVDLTDGALGIEAVHEWLDKDSFTSLARLGDESGDPHVRITDIAGLFDLPEIEDNSEPNTETVGTTPYPSYARGKTVTYTVAVRGTTAQMMRRGAAALRTAFGPDPDTGLAKVRLMVISPTSTYADGADPLPSHSFNARCLQFVQGQDAQDRGPGATFPYTRTVVIGLRLYDPRIFEFGTDEDPRAIGNPGW